MENVNFNIFDKSGAQTIPMIGYSLPFEIFRFVPNFNSVGNYISDKKVIWNFGDNTTSTDLTAYHSYKFPGTYPITLTVFNSSGDGTLSSYLSTIKISNYINDYITLTVEGDPVVQSGQNNVPIYLTRYNSHQTSLSGKNTVISLAVSGNKTPFYTSAEYYADKNVQYISSSRFLIDTDLGLTVVDEVSTTNDFIYAYLENNNVVLALTSSPTSVLAGSSGTAVFYYYEDYETTTAPFIPSPTPSVTPSPSVTPTASITPTPTVTPSPSRSATPSITPTRSITPSVSPTIPATPSVTPTRSITPTTSVTPSITPTSSVSISPTPSITPTKSITPTASVTPTVPGSVSATPSITPTASITPTSSVSPTPLACTSYELYAEYDTGSGNYILDAAWTYCNGSAGFVFYDNTPPDPGPFGPYCVQNGTLVVNTGSNISLGSCAPGTSPSVTPTRSVTPTVTPTASVAASPGSSPSPTPTPSLILCTSYGLDGILNLDGNCELDAAWTYCNGSAGFIYYNDTPPCPGEFGPYCVRDGTLSVNVGTSNNYGSCTPGTSPSVTPTRTPTPSPTPTRSVTPTVTPTASVAASPGSTPSMTPSPTPTPSPILCTSYGLDGILNLDGNCELDAAWTYCNGSPGSVYYNDTPPCPGEFGPYCVRDGTLTVNVGTSNNYGSCT